MTYLDQLRERRSASNATEQKLRLYVRDDETQAVLVVEGEEDSGLYTDAFNKVVDGKFARVIICNGKGDVLGLRDFADANFADEMQLMFFIDRDHDDFLGLAHGDERTYVTDDYSIEWDACTEGVMFSLVARHYALSVNDPIWDVVKAKYHELMKSWIGHAKPIMQAIVVARRTGEVLDLEQLSLSDICRLNDGALQRTDSGLEVLLANAGCARSPSSKALAQCHTELADCDDRLYIRGKLVIQFFCQFFQRLDEICGRPAKIDGRYLATGVQIGKNNYFQFVLDDWAIPDSLREFFASWESRQTT